MQIAAQDLDWNKFKNRPISKRQKKQNENKEVAVTTIASIRNSEHETTCEKCGETLIAPEWSEYVSEGLVLNLWSCWNCGQRFETEAFIPTDARSKNDDNVLKEFCPSLLVA
jgi:ribosomal protein L37AE/L43A